MSNIIKCKCPKCGKEASGYDEITEFFGWRRAIKTVPQSYCRECRKIKKIKE